MDRNSIIGIILIAAIFIVMGIFNQPGKEELERRKIYNDSVAAVRAQHEELNKTKLAEPDRTAQAADSLALIASSQRYGEFAAAVFGANEFYTLENELIAVTFSTKGGRPYSVRLKDYRRFDSMPLVLFDGDTTVFNINFYSRTNAPVATNNLYFKADSALSKTTLATDGPESVKFRLTGENGQYLEYTYTLKPNTYQLDMQMAFHGIPDPTNRMSNLELNWEILSPQQEKGWTNEATYTSLYFKPSNDDVEFFNARSKKDVQEKEIPTQVEWIGYKDQFFASVLMASDQPFSNAAMQSVNQPENSKYIKHFKSVIGLPFSAEKNNALSVSFFFGPVKYKLLKKEYADQQLHDMVSVGKSIIKWINQGIIINIFNWLNKSIANYGIIILLLTIIIKLILLPLTFRSYLSQAKMRVLKPMVDEAVSKYPKEKAMERQQATMAIYKKVGVSPLGGCLPMLLQMPILFAMFRFFPTSIELRQQGFLWATDLSTYDSIFEWSAQIPILSSIYGNHISLFTILMTVTTLLTIKTSGSGQMSDQQMPGMKTMMYIMPITFMFFLNRFSAALTYYYFLANMITFGQNYLFKMFIDENALLKKLEAKKAKPHKKSKWQQRIEDMQKMQQQQAKKRK
ncbi:MAG: membrane protein insertase YidC [Bacteroidales bacterium]|nr:membrane protein insertase YidC [Bacteroidales bacterium]